MVKRRSMVVGLGALATGSGAVFSSAAFSNSVTPSSDMRVVVDEDLTVEPGILFRDGPDPDDDFAPLSSNTPYDSTVRNGNDSPLFGGNDGLNDINVEDLPAASANNEEDGALNLEVAVALDVDGGQIGNGPNGLIQINNDSVDDRDVAIRFSEFGSDVADSGSAGSDEVTEEQVVETYEFYDSSDTQISTDGGTANSNGILDDTQNVPNTVTVGAGETEQIHLAYHTDTHAQAIQDATDFDADPFSESQDTVNLVNEIEIGVTNGTNDA
jgi:hypothetical protein